MNETQTAIFKVVRKRYKSGGNELAIRYLNHLLETWEGSPMVEFINGLILRYGGKYGK